MPRSLHPAGNMASTSKGAKQRTIIESSDEDSDSEQNVESNQKRSAKTEICNNLVKFIINYSGNKYPIKRTDITRALNIPPKEYSEVIQKAQEILKDIYGVNLVEVPEAKSGKLYMACSLFQVSSFNAVSEDQRRESLLLFLILSYIFMKGGDTQEKYILQFIQELPLSLNYEEKEDYVMKLIKDTFVRQLYLKRTKNEVEGKNEPEIHIAWGPRADLEYDKKTLLKTVSDIMNKNPLSFATQYAEAFGDDAGETIMID